MHYNIRNSEPLFASFPNVLFFPSSGEAYRSSMLVNLNLLQVYRMLLLVPPSTRLSSQRMHTQGNAKTCLLIIISLIRIVTICIKRVSVGSTRDLLTPGVHWLLLQLKKAIITLSFPTQIHRHHVPFFLLWLPKNRVIVLSPHHLLNRSSGDGVLSPCLICKVLQLELPTSLAQRNREYKSTVV